MINRLIDTTTALEVYVGYVVGYMKILAIDYPTNRILFSHHGALKEFPEQTRFVFKEW